jgi:hypothetical protein
MKFKHSSDTFDLSCFEIDIDMMNKLALYNTLLDTMVYDLRTVV